MFHPHIFLFGYLFLTLAPAASMVVSVLRQKMLPSLPEYIPITANIR
jgi:hypothetical protein